MTVVDGQQLLQETRMLKTADEITLLNMAAMMVDAAYDEEKPVLSRLVSLDNPETIQEGMVFALETFRPASDGWSAARIEEEVVVTASGCEVITRFPAEELLVGGQRYYTVSGPLPTTRETQSNRTMHTLTARPRR